MNDLPPTAPVSRPARRRWILPAAIVAVVALAGLGAWWLWGSAEAPSKPASAGGAKGGKGFGKGSDPNRIQPVAAAAARVGDVNIVQTALGTATATRTATVRPRVDGLLQGVNFTEGQVVREGEKIAQIDPVPFQVALAQAEGQLARDAAQLNNARLDLDRYRKLLAQDSIASQQVDQQAAQVRTLEGTVKVDEAQVDNARLQLS